MKQWKTWCLALVTAAWASISTAWAQPDSTSLGRTQIDSLEVGDVVCLEYQGQDSTDTAVFVPVDGPELKVAGAQRLEPVPEGTMETYFGVQGSALFGGYGNGQSAQAATTGSYMLRLPKGWLIEIEGGGAGQSFDEIQGNAVTWYRIGKEIYTSPAQDWIVALGVQRQGITAEPRYGAWGQVLYELMENQVYVRAAADLASVRDDLGSGVKVGLMVKP